MEPGDLCTVEFLDMALCGTCPTSGTQLDSRRAAASSGRFGKARLRKGQTYWNVRDDRRERENQNPKRYAGRVSERADWGCSIGATVND